MNTQSVLPMLLALLAIVPVGSVADQRTATTGDRVAEVGLSDLDLSTAQGARLARDRLQVMAERLCAASRGAQRACVDTTVANAFRHIEALTQSRRTALDSVTVGAGVSLADLDLSTLEGARRARERLETIARRLCGELASRRDHGYQPDFAACVQESLSGALAQAEALASSGARSARRTAP